MTVRKYEDKDWESICKIHDSGRKIELEQANLSDAFLTMEETYENEGFFEYEILVLEEQKEVKGFLAYNKEEIAWLYVNPRNHRKGIGTKLIKEAMKNMEDTIYVEVLVNNNAIKIYEKLGFKEKERLKGRMPGNEEYKVEVIVLVYEK